MKHFVVILFLFLFTSLVLSGADVSGRWSGAATISGPNGETQTQPLVMILKQTGEKVEGTIGPDADQQIPLRDTKLDGAKLVSEVDRDGQVFVLELQVEGDRMTGTATAKDGSLSAAVSLSRLT